MEQIEEPKKTNSTNNIINSNPNPLSALNSNKNRKDSKFTTTTSVCSKEIDDNKEDKPQKQQQENNIKESSEPQIADGVEINKEIKKMKISKFDMIKVKVFLGEEYWFIFSRYILSNILKVIRIPSKDTQKIAFELKRKLVNMGLLDVKLDVFQDLLFKTMSDFGYKKDYQEKYLMMNSFYSKRVPMVILISGSVSIGKSTIANKLSEQMNISNVLQTKIVSFVMSGLNKMYNFKPFWKAGGTVSNDNTLTNLTENIYIKTYEKGEEEDKDNNQNNKTSKKSLKEIDIPFIQAKQDNQQVTNTLKSQDGLENKDTLSNLTNANKDEICNSSNAKKVSQDKDKEINEGSSIPVTQDNLCSSNANSSPTKKSSSVNNICQISEVLKDNTPDSIDTSNCINQSTNKFLFLKSDSFKIQGNNDSSSKLINSPSPCLQAYIRESSIIRKGCSLDMLKAFKEGKPVILEGHHIIPKNFIRENEEGRIVMYLPEFENETEHEKALRQEVNNLKIKGLIIPFLITLNDETHKNYILKNNIIQKEDKQDAINAFIEVQEYLKQENNCFIQVDASDKKVEDIIDILNIKILDAIEKEYIKGKGSF